MVNALLRVIGVVLILMGTVSAGCANMEFAKDFKLSQPTEEMWCPSGAASPFPPYCHPDR